MKKSIFLFFAAILCAIGMNAANYLYLKPSSDWKSNNARFAAYFFENGEKWVSMTKVTDDLYRVEIPSGYPKVIFCRMNGGNATNNWSNKWNQTGNLTISGNTGKVYNINGWDNGTWGSSVPLYAKNTTLYILPNSDWKKDNARFAVCFLDGSENWVSCTKVGSTDYYSVTIPNSDLIAYAIFCRMNGGNATNNWSNKWNQTSDLAPSSGKNGVEITGWDNSQKWIVVYDQLSVNHTPTTAADAPNINQTLIKDGSSVTVTAPNAKTGYHWVKWTSSNGSFNDQFAQNTNFTPTAKSAVATANYAENTYTVTISAGTGGTVSHSGSQTIGQVTQTTVTATANDNYEFANWTATGGVIIANTSSASTTITATAIGTLTANFRSTATYSLTVAAGANIESVAGSTDPVVLGESYEIKATPAHGYKFNLWTAEPAENAAFDNASSATTQVKVQNGSVTVTASATEIMSALTTSNTYDEGTPSINAPTTSVSEIGITTTATITAATDIDYTLASWTLENCVRTDDGAENATTITVKSNGDGAAATVTANYNIIPKITLYFVNSDKWATAKCHHWKDGGSTTIWPGDPMEIVGTVHGFNIYKVKFAELEHNLCIFNNDDKGKQTGNLAVQDGKYYYPETDEWYATVAELPTPCTDCSDYAIAGSMNDWSARRNRLKVTANNDIVELTMELTAGDYEFKVAGPGEWYGNSGKYEREHSGNAWTYRIKDDENNDEDNARIYVDMTGEYTFTWKISTKELTITYPELPDFSQQTNTILFRPSTDWKKANARFAAYFFGATEEKWVEMTDTDGDGIYEAINPKANLSVKICRLDPAKAENNWENVWNQSTNYEIPTGVENCWVVNDGEWDGATGIWTVLVGEGDNSTTLSAANSQTVNTLVNRQFESDKLYTISLPFALDASQVETIFGAGTILYQFAQLAKEGDGLVLYFSTPSAIAAATPYLIQPTQDVAAGFTVEDATISTTPNNISFTIDATTVTMKPILSADRATTNGSTEYWLAADKILYNDANTLLSLRALFDITTISGMPPRCRVAFGENVETGLDNITNGENTTIKVIENGQLIIIRNGEKFNAQGIKL